MSIFGYHNTLIYENGGIVLPPWYNEAVKENWNSEKEYNNALFDGIIYSAEEYFIKENNLIILAKKTSFAHYLYSKKNSFKGDLSCKSIAANCLIITSDNKLVMLEMSSKTSMPGIIKFIGGSISEHDLLKDSHTLSPAVCIERELMEEIGLGITNQYIDNMIVKYILTRNTFRFIDFLFILKLRISHRDLLDIFSDHKNRLIKNGHSIEAENLVIIDNNRYSIIKFFGGCFINRTLDYIIDFFKVYINDMDCDDILTALSKNNF
jgi:8-oxo-dGTP pyrophosphatase MutT (NUDIX family)